MAQGCGVRTTSPRKASCPGSLGGASLGPLLLREGPGKAPPAVGLIPPAGPGGQRSEAVCWACQSGTGPDAKKGACGDPQPPCSVSDVPRAPGQSLEHARGVGSWGQWLGSPRREQGHVRLAEPAPFHLGCLETPQEPPERTRAPPAGDPTDTVAPSLL